MNRRGKYAMKLTELSHDTGTLSWANNRSGKDFYNNIFVKSINFDPCCRATHLPLCPYQWQPRSLSLHEEDSVSGELANWWHYWCEMSLWSSHLQLERCLWYQGRQERSKQECASEAIEQDCWRKRNNSNYATCHSSFPWSRWWHLSHHTICKPNRRGHFT